MASDKTHREIKNPQISIRYLAEYMHASERARRTILKGCKYQKVARVIQHDEAKLVVCNFIRKGGVIVKLLEEADKIRNRVADSDFEKELNEHNADYIMRYAKIADQIVLPMGELSAPGKALTIKLNGTNLRVDLHFKIRRLTKTNKVRVGGGMLRYSKGKALVPEVGDWQSALLFGVLSLDGIVEDQAEPEKALCVTLDAQSGSIRCAPSNAISRFKNAEAACATIANAWANIEPPNGAVL